MHRHAAPARRGAVAGTFLSAGRGYAAPCVVAAFAAGDYFYFYLRISTQRPPEQEYTIADIFIESLYIL